MSKFEIVRFLWLVEIRDFELCDRVLLLLLLLLLLRTTETLAPASALTIGRSSMKFGMQLYYGNASGCFQAFFKKFNFRRFLPFFIEKTWFLLYETLAPASALTIHRSSMKFGMQLYYGNASGCFQAFFKKFNFRRFSPFFIDGKTWFSLYETLIPASALTIALSSMKFGMQLYYGNASKCFQAFFKKFNFRRFWPFS